jgi:hypothetical protein
MSRKLECDVLVAGAGIAGIAAAVKAARTGARVVLVERYGFVGGSATAGMVSPFMKHSVGGETLVRGVFEELEAGMRRRHGMIDNGFLALAFRSAAIELLSAAGARILPESEIFSVSRDGDRITGVEIVTAGGTRWQVQAQVFIDCSGDGQLIFLAGAPWQKGDEQSGRLQAMTLFFRMGGIDLATALEYVAANRSEFFDWMEYDFDPEKIISVAGYFSHIRRAIEQGRVDDSLQYIFYTTLPGSGEASFNTSNILDLDGSDSLQLTKAELDGRRQVLSVVRLLQDEIPGFAHARLLETGVQVGVRETRRAVGEYLVTGADILQARKFDDAIARGCYGVDIHGQRDEQSRMDEIPEGDYYEIPARSLLVRDTANLLVAGRCISSTREGQAALRIMPTSAATGEACGAWAGLAIRQQKALRATSIPDIQQQIWHNLNR